MPLPRSPPQDCQPCTQPCVHGNNTAIHLPRTPCVASRPRTKMDSNVHFGHFCLQTMTVIRGTAGAAVDIFNSIGWTICHIAQTTNLLLLHMLCYNSSRSMVPLHSSLCPDKSKRGRSDLVFNLSTSMVRKVTPRAHHGANPRAYEP